MLNAETLTYGVFATFMLGILNLFLTLRHNGKTRFVNMIVPERVKWINKLRDDLSLFAGLTHHWVASALEETDESKQLLKEIDRLRYLIPLYLNPDEPKDSPEQKIITHLREIPNLTHHPDREQLMGRLRELQRDSQDLLHKEWKKAVDEARKGRLIT